MVLSVVFWLSQRQWLEVGLTWEWKELFLVGNFVCESLLSVKLPVLSCPFPGGCVYWGAFPSCLSLGEAVAAFSTEALCVPLQAVPSCSGPWGSALVGASSAAVPGCVWPSSFGGPVGAALSSQPLAVTFSLQIDGGCCFCSPVKPQPGVLLPCGCVWVTQTLISHLITPFRTTKQCWGSRVGCFWRTHR